MFRSWLQNRIAPVEGALVPQESRTQPRPFWSVIVPLFERREYLRQCLDSVLDQDPGPEEMEIIVADDASPCDLRDFVEDLGRGRVCYARNAANLGERANTNRAIERSLGRWIHILHDDDWVLPGFYSTLRQGIETSPDSPGVAFCMYAAWHGNRNAWWSPLPFRDGAGLLGRDFIIRLAQACPLNLCSVIFSRAAFESVGLFREDLPQTSEWEWYVRCALKLPWHYQPETLACYRVHSDSLTHNRARLGQNARDFRRAIEAIALMLPADLAPKVVPVSQEFHARQLFDSALKLMDANDSELASLFLTEGLAINPLGPGRPGLAALLQHPGFGALRDDIRTALLLKHGS
jgi:protein O-GlcNAc transferase